MELFHFTVRLVFGSLSKLEVRFRLRLLHMLLMTLSQCSCPDSYSSHMNDRNFRMQVKIKIDPKRV